MAGVAICRVIVFSRWEAGDKTSLYNTMKVAGNMSTARIAFMSSDKMNLADEGGDISIYSRPRC